jgi:hypothetical protein
MFSNYDMFRGPTPFYPTPTPFYPTVGDKQRETIRPEFDGLISNSQDGCIP